MATKFYGVKIGKNKGIYETWEDCKTQVSGFLGAKFKSFQSREEAEKYIDDNSDNVPQAQSSSTLVVDEINKQIEEKIKQLNQEEVVAFVDGSYSQEKETVSFAALLFTSNGKKTVLYNSYNDKYNSEFIQHRNVTGEIEAVKEAIQYSIQLKKKKIYIYTDYVGVKNWITEGWKAKKKYSKDYVAFIEKVKRDISIEFVKIPSHKGILYNEEVDSIARKALKCRSHKTCEDGSVYFVGFNISVWDDILNKLKEETDNDFLIKKLEPKDYKQQIIVEYKTNKVTISCYRNTNSYVQGKHSNLFDQIISTALLTIKSTEQTLYILNSYFTTEIQGTDLEKKLLEIMPHYQKIENSEKHHQNLLTAVYYYLLEVEMPDYTSFIFPACRAFEFYLHTILNKYLKLATTNNNGQNTFSFFSYDANTGDYKFNCKNKKNLLSLDQLDYLNNLYTRYNKVRHHYFHWSSTDISTDVVDDIQKAQQIIKDTLSLFDKFYELWNP